jgi:hypothetical protein
MDLRLLDPALDVVSLDKDLDPELCCDDRAGVAFCGLYLERGKLSEKGNRSGRDD